jgi:conjugative transfer signal peptidase TraF
MTRRGYLLSTLGAAALSTSLFAAVALRTPRPRLIWNASASAPVGLYRLTPVGHPAIGTLVAITPPAGLAGFLAKRRYLAIGVPLLKHIAAPPGAIVCRLGNHVTINRRVVALARNRDGRGRRLPVWRGCRVIAPNQLFLLNAAADSMDGRYFGPIPAIGLLGRATPIFTRDAATEPFQWRGTAAVFAHSPTRKGQFPCR